MDYGQFWNALAAVSTTVSVVVALFLPFWLQRIEKQKACRMIARELYNNMPKLKDIAAIPDEGVIPIAEGQPQITIPPFQFFAARRRHLSTSQWNHYKFHITTDQFTCFEPFYSKINHILTLEGVELIQFAMGRIEAKTITKDYDAMKPKCRYLREL